MTLLNSKVNLDLSKCQGFLKLMSDKHINRKVREDRKETIRLIVLSRTAHRDNIHSFSLVPAKISP